eukprot:Colp12_sorted_trinity150504_noHs@32261
MEDRTEIFKQISAEILSKKKGTASAKVHDILPKKKTTPFHVQSKALSTAVSELQNFLVNNRGRYLATSKGMTDAERDKVDLETNELLKRCQEGLSTLRSTIQEQRSTFSEQNYLHRVAAADILELFVKNAAKIMSSIRTVRLKQALQHKQLTTLQIPTPASEKPSAPIPKSTTDITE